MALADVYVELRASIADFQAKFAIATDEIRALEEAQAQAAARMSESATVAGAAMDGEAVQSAAASREMGASYDLASIQAEAFASKIETASTQAALSNEAMAAKMQADMVKLEAAQAKAATATEGVGTAMKKAEADSNAASMGQAKSFGLVAVGAAGVAAVTVDMAAKYQQSTTKLVTSAGESKAAIDQVSNGMLDMAGQVGFTALQLSQSMYTVEGAGYHGADGLTVLKAAAQGAKNEGADLTTVADAVSTALTDYHLPASAAATVTSQLITAVGQGKSNMQDFSGALHSITPLAASMGISLADVTGSLAEMTSHGMSADQASQNLAETLRTLQKPSSQATAALSQIGMTVNDVQDSLSSKGLQGTLEQISQAILTKMGPSGKVMLDAFNTSKQAAANLNEALKVAPPDIQKLGQSMIDGSMSVAQYRAAIKTLPVDQQNLAAGLLSLIQQSQGFTNTLKAGGPQALTFSQMLQAVTGNATTMNTALMLTGENSASAQNNIKLISGATADANGNVKGWAETQQNMNQKLSEAKGAAESLGIRVGQLLLPALTQILGVVANVTQFLADHKAAADALAAVLGIVLVGAVVTATAKIAQFGASMATNLFKPITGGIGFLKNFATATDGTAGGAVRSFASTAASGFGKAASAIGDVAKAAGSLAADLGSSLLSGLKNVGSALVDLSKAAGAGLVAGLRAIGTALVETVFPALMEAAAATWSFTVALLSNPITWIVIGIIALGVAIYELITHWSQVEKFLRGAWNGFLNWAKGIWRDLSKFFGDLWKDIQKIFSDAWNAVVGFVQQWYPEILGILSGGILLVPALIFKYWSQISAFLQRAWDDAIGVVVGAGRAVYDAVVNGWNSVLDWLSGIGGRILGAIGDLGNLLWSAGYNILVGFYNGLVSMWNHVQSFVGGIADWIASHKGPIEYDRQLLTPHGNAIMEGLLNGLQQGGNKVNSYVAGFAQSIRNAAAGGMSASATVSVLGASVDPFSVAAGTPALSAANSAAQQPIVVNINVQGSVHSENSLKRTIQDIFQQHAGRNVTNGLSGVRF